MLKKFNRNVINWEINTESFPYIKLKDLEEGKDYPLRGCFTSPDNGYGEGAVLITDSAMINIPQRYVSLVNEIREDPEAVEQIKAGKAAFHYVSFQPKDHKNKGYRIVLVDVE